MSISQRTNFLTISICNCCRCYIYIFTCFCTSCCFTVFSIFFNVYFFNLIVFWFIFTYFAFHISKFCCSICDISVTIFGFFPCPFAFVLMFTSWCCKCVNCCITSTIFCFSRSLIYSSYSCFASSVMRYQFCIYRFCVSQCLFDRITVRLICCVVIFFQQTVNFINLFRACFTFKILECYACFIITPLSICYCVIMSFCCVLLCCIPDCFSLFVCRICLFIIRFYRLCNTSSTFWANIVVCFITYVI